MQQVPVIEFQAELAMVLYMMKFFVALASPEQDQSQFIISSTMSVVKTILSSSSKEVWHEVVVVVGRTEVVIGCMGEITSRVVDIGADTCTCDGINGWTASKTWGTTHVVLSRAGPVLKRIGLQQR